METIVLNDPSLPTEPTELSYSRKNQSTNQHFNKSIYSTAFINSCQHMYMFCIVEILTEKYSELVQKHLFYT